MTRIVTQRDAEHDSRLLREFAASGISVGCANTFLNPVEVVKTRMQLTGAPAASAQAAVQQQPPIAASARAGPAGGGSSWGPASARFMSHTTAPLKSSATTLESFAGSAAAASSGAGSAAYRPWVFPQPGAAAAAAATALRSATATAAADGAPAAAAAAAAVAKRPGFLATAGLIYRQEGARGFTRGVQASACRAVFNGGIRLGLYDPIKQLMSADGSGRDLHVGQKLAAGSISGCIGAVLTTPMELVKTRLQAPSATTRSAVEVLRSVVSQQGVAGLWRGATPSVARLILLNSSMVATYDEVKGRISRLTGWAPGIQLTLSSSMVAGLVTTTVINPTDVIRAYMQTGRGSSLLAVAGNILAKEGPRGFMKGWTAAYCRTGPQTLIIFTVSEVVRPLFGLNAIGSSG